MNLSGQVGKSTVVPCSGASWVSGGDGVVSDQFPMGLRVLVVDDDPTCLNLLERMLINCHYEATKCIRADEALLKLRERKNGYDIVISDVHMPDMDGFKLLECIGLEMDLPVIMMSADDSRNVVMKGVTHGACDYLIKPVRIEALKNIWQHVVRRKKYEWKDLDQSGSAEDGERVMKQTDEADASSSAVNEGSWRDLKRKMDDEDEGDERDDSHALKKPRVVWTIELHQQFVLAVNHLGIDKAVPKKILEMMNIPGLTRENVASHLQKYRLYLRKMDRESQNQNGGLDNSFMGQLDSGFTSLSTFPTLASTGHIPTQNLASIQCNRSILPHQRNLFSFETSKPRFSDVLQNGNGKQISLLHGVPTSMEPRHLTNLQSFHGINMYGLVGEPQSKLRIGHDEPKYNSISNPSSMLDFSGPQNPHNPHLSAYPRQYSKAPIQEQVNYDVFNDLEMKNAGLIFDMPSSNTGGHHNAVTQPFNPIVPDKGQNGYFTEQFDQDDLMNEILKQEEDGNSMVLDTNEFGFAGYLSGPSLGQNM